MGTYRFVFNWVVSKKDEQYKETGKSGNYFSHRKTWMVELREKYPWVDEAPAHTVYGAMMKVDEAYKMVLRKRKAGNNVELPRCRRRLQKSFFILGNAITENGIYTRKLGKMKSSEPLPSKPSDSVIMFVAGKWYLKVTEEAQICQSENQGTVCAIDPGVRSFITGFATNGIFKIQQGGFGRIVRLLQWADKLQSIASKEKRKQRKERLYLALARMKQKVKNLVDDLHYQAISWLLEHHDIVVCPNSDFTSAVAKKARKIGSKSVRSLMTWAFARFRNRLIHKATLLGKKIVLVCESYTSKTANWTGEIKPKLGGSKTITSAGIKMDRDVNGALGIFLKALLAQPLEIVNCKRK